ncbi:RNA polymerase sigma factor SigJ [Kribbella sp. NPDC048928]|uniref:RNA polymerase sigma factor SigJ n=1 Tax=Kribbella sp. NPDC048928 TaxID=3364111 RepID=UPI00371878A9
MQLLISERRQLINVAYRLLGSVADAEDVVQETYARWYALTPAEAQAIDNPAAWLTKVAGRICLTQLTSARVRRERYVGEWIPEPVPDPSEWSTADPADLITLDESVGMAFLVVLESMTPAERVAFVLHDVFRYPYKEIAEIVGRSTAACRQLASSARRRLDASRPTPAAVEEQIVRDFKRAWESKDIDALIGLLDPEATTVADTGGHAPVFVKSLSGAAQIAETFTKFADRLLGLDLKECLVNGRPGLRAESAGTTVTVYAFDTKAGRITRIWAIRNPDKLQTWSDTAH